MPREEVVTPLGLESDGRLRAREHNGDERLLCTDYLLVGGRGARMRCKYRGIIDQDSELSSIPSIDYMHV